MCRSWRVPVTKVRGLSIWNNGKVASQPAPWLGGDLRSGSGGVARTLCNSSAGLEVFKKLDLPVKDAFPPCSSQRLTLLWTPHSFAVITMFKSLFVLSVLGEP